MHHQKTDPQLAQYVANEKNKLETETPDGHASYIDSDDLSEIEDFLHTGKKKKKKSAAKLNVMKAQQATINEASKNKSTHDEQSKRNNKESKVEEEDVDGEAKDPEGNGEGDDGEAERATGPLVLDMEPINKLRRYLEQYDSNIAYIIESPETKDPETGNLLLDEANSYVFKSGLILGYCIFKVSRRELDPRLLDLESEITPGSLKSNWLTIQRELTKLDIFLNWSQIVLLIRGENFDVINKALVEVARYIEIQDHYFDNPRMKARKRSKVERTETLKHRGWRYILYEIIRSKDFFSVEGLYLKTYSSIFGAIVTLIIHLTAFIIFVQNVG